MGMEIERKFLVAGDGWRDYEATLYCQGYLNRGKPCTVRVRIAGELGFLTVKGPTSGASRAEFEYRIPVEDAKEMLVLCDGPVVEKYRRVIPYAELKWEVDEFLGDNSGLVIAEVELQSEQQELACPDWIGPEVTGDARYYNSNLSIRPYKTW